MFNSQKTKQASSTATSTVEPAEERPDSISYWFHKFMPRNGTASIRTVKTFMDEDTFSDLRIAKIVRNKDIKQLRFIQDRMQTWVLENCHHELNGEASPDEFDSRSFYVWRLDDLLDIAIVGIGHNTSFYCLAAAEYNGMNSEVPGYQKEFLRSGFRQLCVALDNDEATYHDGTTIKDHSFPFIVIMEFLSAVIACMQDVEMAELATLQSPN